MALPIAYDLVRVFSGPLFSTPRGIDRIDLGYARHFAESWRGDCGGTLPAPWGIVWYDRDRLLKLIDRLEELWSERACSKESEVGLDEIKSKLAGRSRSIVRKWARNDRREIARRFANLFAAGGIPSGIRRLSSAPKNSIYVNIGHVGLAFPCFVSWLRRRPDIKPVFMLHDMIPLENPEWVSEAGLRNHHKMTENAARYAAALIATSPTARSSVMREFALRGRKDIPVATVPLPVAPLFLEKFERDEELASHNYFVVCGALQPRKNHVLLINVWRELVRRRGPHAPKLVVVGSTGWGGEPIRHLVTRCREIEDHLIFAEDLSSPALRSIMSHAKGVLMASHAEGYGLPIIEALCVRTPVVVSDIPAHHDVAGDYGIYRHPIDGLGWLAAVESLTDDTEDARAARQRTLTYRPPTWPNYFAKIENFLSQL